jgi:hypothetical protein
MSDLKDTVATGATGFAASSALLNWNEILTLFLIVTGIVLNIIRIYEIKKSKGNQD